MAKSLADAVRERPVDRASVDELKRRMTVEVRAYRLRELRGAATSQRSNSRLDKM